MSRVLQYLRHRRSCGADVTAVLGMRLEDVHAEIARLEAQGLICARVRHKQGRSPWVEWEVVEEAPCERIRLIEPCAVGALGAK